MSRPLQLVQADHDRAMPFDDRAELAVLSACMHGPEPTEEAAAIVQPEHFYREGNRRLYTAMLALAARKTAADPVTLHAELGKDFESIGGADFLVTVMDAVPTGANVSYHARLVLEAARLRQLIAAGTEIVRNAYDPDGVPVSVLVDRAEQLVAACAEQTTTEPVRVKSELFGTFERLEKLQANPGKLAGLSWGIEELDRWTGGMHAGDLTVIAARPSMGKTAFVTGTALHVAIAEQAPVALFSLEMSRQQIVQRMLCYEAIVDLRSLLTGELAPDDFGRLAQASAALNTAPLWIDDTAALSLLELRAKTRKILAAEPGLALIVIDYIQLMRGGNRPENRQQEVSEISRGLKACAKEFDVPIIALSQLSRAPEQRSSHRPQLSDLRESGSIEQDADVVGFLFRQEYYETADVINEKGLDGKAELIIGKQRNGPTGTIDLHFRKQCARFEAAPAKWGNRA